MQPALAQRPGKADRAEGWAPGDPKSPTGKAPEAGPLWKQLSILLVELQAAHEGELRRARGETDELRRELLQLRETSGKPPTPTYEVSAPWQPSPAAAAPPPPTVPVPADKEAEFEPTPYMSPRGAGASEVDVVTGYFDAATAVDNAPVSQTASQSRAMEAIVVADKKLLRDSAGLSDKPLRERACDNHEGKLAGLVADTNGLPPQLRSAAKLGLCDRPLREWVPELGTLNSLSGTQLEMSFTPSGSNGSHAHSSPFVSARRGSIVSEPTDEKVQELRRQFSVLDRDNEGAISVELLHEICAPMYLAHIEDAIEVLNHAMGNGLGDALNFDGYKAVIFSNNLRELLGDKHAKTVKQMREKILARVSHKDTQSLVANFAGVKMEDMQEGTVQRQKFLYRIEPVVSVAICLNVLLLAISTDHEPEWVGWLVIDWFFAMLFLFEIILRICTLGMVEFCTGPHSYWYFLDTAIVVIAFADLLIHHVIMIMDDDGTEPKYLMVLRTIRLLRLVRIVRVLQLKIFKDLQLMIQGVASGLRTLFWAIILFIFFLFCVGLVLRQLVGLNPPDCSELSHVVPNGSPITEFDLRDRNLDGWLSRDEFEQETSCNVAETHLYVYRDPLFGNILISMFTVFRCIVDSCDSVEGSPLPVLMMDTYGWPFLIMYVLCMFFVTYGLSNLIMAIFVENTMEAAKMERTRRNVNQKARHVLVAKKLHRLVSRFVGTGSFVIEEPETQPYRGFMRKCFEWVGWVQAPRRIQRSQTLDTKGEVQINRESFNHIMMDPQVTSLLDDLDISAPSREGMFDVLDADGSGTLEAAEMVEGILKLRGSADKSDVVAALLGVRALQRSLKQLEAMAIENQARLEESYDMTRRVAAAIPSVSTSLHGQ